MSRPGSDRRRPRRVGWLALCGLLALAACTDGYPTDDEPQIDPARLTREQLLAVLNDLGGEAHLERRWHYEVDSACRLRVKARPPGPAGATVALEGAVVDTRSTDGRFEILVTPGRQPSAQPVVVFASSRWTDSVRVRSLLVHLELRCGNPVPPGG